MQVNVACHGAWGGGFAKEKNDIELIQCCCKRNAYGVKKTKELQFCEDHMCREAELAHFVLLFMAEKYEYGESEVYARFDAKYVTMGRDKGRLCGGCIKIGCIRNGNMMEIILSNQEHCRRIFMLLAHLCFHEVDGYPFCASSINNENDGSISPVVVRAYNGYMVNIVWKKMEDLRACEMIPGLILTAMADNTVAYPIRWNNNFIRTDMVLVRPDAETCFIGYRLHMSHPLPSVVLLVGSCDGRYIVYSGMATVHEMLKQIPLQRMIIRSSQRAEEPHTDLVLYVPPSLVLLPDGPDALMAINSELASHVHSTNGMKEQTVCIPSQFGICPRQCRMRCWVEWNAIRLCTPNEMTTIGVVFLIRGGILHVPIYTVTSKIANFDMLIPCILAQPHHMTHNAIAIHVIPPNVQIFWRRASYGHGREPFINITSDGQRFPMPRIHFTDTMC
jgi:hypothetical protein